LNAVGPTDFSNGRATRFGRANLPSDQALKPCRFRHKVSISDGLHLEFDLRRDSCLQEFRTSHGPHCGPIASRRLSCISFKIAPKLKKLLFVISSFTLINSETTSVLPFCQFAIAADAQPDSPQRTTTWEPKTAAPKQQASKPALLGGAEGHARVLTAAICSPLTGGKKGEKAPVKAPSPPACQAAKTSSARSQTWPLIRKSSAIEVMARVRVRRPLGVRRLSPPRSKFS